MKRFCTLTGFRVSLLVTLGMLLLYLGTAQSIIGRHLEAKALDLRFWLRGVKQPDTSVALVGIDDQSIAALGRWPWSRRRFADIVRRLEAAGARVIVFDMLFLEPEVNTTQDTRRIQTGFDSTGWATLDPQLEAFYPNLAANGAASDPDRQFAQALQEADNVVLAFSFDFAATERLAAPGPQTLPPFVALSAYRSLQHLNPEAMRRLPHAVRVLYPIPTLGQQAQALGHVRAGVDIDGTLRYEYPVVAYQDTYYPSLAVQAARLYLGLAPEEVKVQLGVGLQLGPLFIPTDETMSMLVNYYGPQKTFPTYSFIDVLQGRLPDKAFRDKIVLIGGMAVGVDDRFVTPFSPAFPGLEKQATVMTNILQAELLIKRDTTGLIDLACIVILGLLLGWLSPKLPLLWGHFFAVCLGGTYLALNYLAFTQADLWVNLLFPLLTVVFDQAAITIYRSRFEERQKRLLRQAFQHYVHPSVVEQISQDPERLKLGGDRRELTVLFSDIRNFSRISERLPPEELVQLLNEYFTAMTRLVLADNGLLDKYIGDAIMAVYGAPLPLPDHAYQACHTALHMVTTLQTLQQRWQAQGLPFVDIGIGINTGPMIVGNVGSDLRFTYTVMGDAVNLGARLEGANKTYGTHIIISESTWGQVKDRMITRELDIVRVKGKERPVRIFEAIGFPPIASAQATLTHRFAAGLHAYRERQWEKALDLFRYTLELLPNDRPSQLYIRRCEAFMATPPPTDWDGVYVMQTK